MKLTLKSKKLTITLTLLCTSFINITPIVAQTPQKPPTIRLILPPIPPGNPPGGRVRGGARRGLCQKEVKPELTALVPSTQSSPTITNVWALTATERPTFWVYYPYSKANSYTTEFELQDDSSKTPIYKTAIAPPEKPGVIGVYLPSRVPPLTVGKRYRWYFTVDCAPQQSSPIYVEGAIQRVNLSQAVTQQLKTAQPRQRVAIYAENGIWHEALTTLAELRQKNPQDAALQADWENLLQAIGLADIAQKAISSDPR
ncbi:MAG: DUF928 domain-containing protein [Cyanomargarita calcarea GSE-NOS-MK-12-04C]|uniref:DUF928 domain-containing protein n=1 Tax=Cyanomargarita calcarea GSE-NOS-MK-12-04C TaxID=2839659 RepID=A0A951QV74_9CYAN|nr:DUF928 domain-containing protein [Cyanomargarita calcarea GSE-NOS-MK-12-04C]